MGQGAGGRRWTGAVQACEHYQLMSLHSSLLQSKGLVWYWGDGAVLGMGGGGGGGGGKRGGGVGRELR